jgi:O-antigen/teichoic acid export membrane protein
MLPGLVRLKSQLKLHLSNSLYRNSYLLMVGTLSTNLIGFVTLTVATRYFSTEAVGISSAALAAISLISVISEMGLGIAIIRYLPKAGDSGNDLLNSFIFVNMAVSTIITLLFLVGINFWSPALNIVWQQPIFLVCFIFFSVGTALQTIIINSFLAKRTSQYIVITNIIGGVLKLIFIIICAFLINSALGIFISGGLSTIIGLLFAISYFIPRIQNNFHFHFRINIMLLKQIFTYSISNYFARLILQIPYPLISLMVVNTLGAENNAYYSVAWSIAAILQIIPSSTFNSLFAEIANDEKAERFNVFKSLRQMLYIAVPAIIFTFFISGYLLLIFGQGYSENGVWVLRLMAIATLPWGINYLYVSIARSGNNMSGAVKLTVLSQGLSLLLIYILMLKTGLIGIGIGYLIGQSLAASIAVVLLLRKFHHKSNILNNR